MSQPPTDTQNDNLRKLLHQLSTVLDDIVGLTIEGDFLLGEVHRALGKKVRQVQEKPSVLLVDDDERLLKALARTLSAFTITTATTVAEAIDLIRTVHFDAVISDFDITEGNGVDVLRVALREQPDALRVLHTANPSPPSRAGHIVQHIVAKPAAAGVLEALVRAHL